MGTSIDPVVVNRIRGTSLSEKNYVRTAIGIPSEVLDGKSHPCPKPDCGGEDRFSLAKKGYLHCRKCYSRRNGDLISDVRWWTNAGFTAAVEQIADLLNLNGIEEMPTNVKVTPQKQRDTPRPVFNVQPPSSQDTDTIKATFFKNMPPIAAQSFDLFSCKIVAEGRRRYLGVPVYADRLDSTISGYVLYNLDGTKHKLSRGAKSARLAKGSCKGFVYNHHAISSLNELPDEIVVTAGVSDALALASFDPTMPVVTTSNGEGQVPSEEFLSTLLYRRVVMILDNDRPGERRADVWKRLLRKAEVEKFSVVRLPGPGKDVRDWLNAKVNEGLGTDEIKTQLSKFLQEAEVLHSVDTRVEVEVLSNEGATTDSALPVLAKFGRNKDQGEEHRTFYRGSQLFGITPEGESQPRMYELSAATLRDRISRAVRFVTENDGKITENTIPKWVVDSIHNRGYYHDHFQKLAQITRTPTLRPDGSVLDIPGYDESSGIYLVPDGEYPPIPSQPSQADARRSVGEILSYVCDVPFKTRADESAWLCMLLSVIGRPAIHGCLPIFAVTANTRGAGKSLLADVAATIALGQGAGRKMIPKNEDEQRKMITSVAIDGMPMVLFDNLATKLGGACLDAAVTSRTWNDRRLHSNKTTGDLELNPVWVATGNNITFGGDMSRRVLPIRLTVDMANPEHRGGFKHPNLLSAVSNERRHLVTHALTILRAFILADKGYQGPSWGSFQEFVDLIQGAVTWCGLEDPLQTREICEENDEAKSHLGMLIEGLKEADPKRNGMSAREILEKSRLINPGFDETSEPKYRTLTEAISLLLRANGDARKLAANLGPMIGRVVDGDRICKKTGHKKTQVYYVESDPHKL